MKTRNYAIAVAVAAAISLIGASTAKADDHRGVVVDRGHVEFNLGKDVHVSAVFGSPCLPRPAVAYVEDRCISEHDRLERIRLERERLERERIEHERWEREHHFHDHDHDRDHDHWH